MKTMKRVLAAVMIATMLLTVCGTAAMASTAVHTTGKCHLRAGAGLDYDVKCTIPKNTGLTATSTKTDDRGIKWYKVKYDGITGWVSSVYCKKGAAPAQGDTVVATGNTYIRSKGNLNGAKLSVLHEGETARYLSKSTVDDRGVRWYYITYAGYTGWVSSVNSYIR